MGKLKKVFTPSSSVPFNSPWEIVAKNSFFIYNDFYVQVSSKTRSIRRYPR